MDRKFRRSSNKQPGALLALYNIQFATSYVGRVSALVLLFLQKWRVGDSSSTSWSFISSVLLTCLCHFLLAPSSGSLCCLISLSISDPSVWRFSCKRVKTFRLKYNNIWRTSVKDSSTLSIHVLWLEGFLTNMCLSWVKLCSRHGPS